MDQLSISIIIPACNVAGYIEHCLDSILKQTFTDFEAIIIDDGSTDTTGDILDKYTQKDCRIKVIHIQNAGVSAARNLGIKMAQGQYLLFFDGDDFFEPYTCAELIKTIKEKEADIVIYGYYRYCDGLITQTCLPVFPEGIYCGCDIIPELLSRFVGVSLNGIQRWLKGETDGLYVENPALWRCFVNAEVIRDNGLMFDTKLKVGEDTVFISDVLSCTSRCYVHHKCYYYLVYRESSTIATYEKNALAKLEGKARLITSRMALTERVLERSGIDITPYWQGTVVMSCLELAFLLARSGSSNLPFAHRYRYYLQYARLEESRRAVRSLKLHTKPSIRLIPVLMLKWGWHLPLFICAALLNLTRYKFIRG